MSVVTSSFVHFRYGPVDRESLLSIADLVCDRTEIAVREFLPQLEVTIAASAEEASLKTRTKVLATAGAIYIGIGNFGGFADGVREIVSVSRQAMSHVNEQIIEEVASPSATIRTRVDTGLPGKLARLFERVESGELTAHEAQCEANSILRRVPEPTPNGMSGDIQSEISRLAKHAPEVQRRWAVAPVQTPEVTERPLPDAPDSETPPLSVRRAEVWIDERRRRHHRIW